VRACEQANYIITHKELEKVALDAAGQSGVDKRFVYTMGSAAESSQTELKSIKCVLSSMRTIRLVLVPTHPRTVLVVSLQ
jgi:hypothetical protein